MKEKAQDLVYLDTGRYISLDMLKSLFWMASIIPCFMLTMGIAAVEIKGVTWKSLFPLLSIAVWSLCYWLFVFAIKSNLVKKSFALRFLVNGTTGLFLFSLFWILFASVNLVADKPLVDFLLCLWIIPVYVLVSCFIIFIVLLGVRTGIFGKLRKVGQTGITLAVTSFFGAAIPLASALGKFTAVLLRKYASLDVQEGVGTFCLVLLIFIPALAHINFVQYFYCKKYNIVCDENGNTTSPKLEANKRTIQKDPRERHARKGTGIFLKILLIALSIPVAFFVILFVIGFIKAVVKNF